MTSFSRWNEHGSVASPGSFAMRAELGALVRPLPLKIDFIAFPLVAHEMPAMVAEGISTVPGKTPDLPGLREIDAPFGEVTGYVVDTERDSIIKTHLVGNHIQPLAA